MPEISDEARRILHQVGRALIVFGLLDIGMMIYCVVNSVNYSSSFNVFAVLAGVYVRRGQPWWVMWTTRAAGFYAAAFCTMIPLFSFVFPVDLAALEFRLHPVVAVAGTLAMFGVIALLVWVYRELRRVPVLAVYGDPRRSPSPFWIAPLCGAILALGLVSVILVFMHGEAEHKAVALAAAKAGPRQHYFVTKLSYAGDRGRAEVLAYDDRAIQTIEVEW